VKRKQAEILLTQSKVLAKRRARDRSDAECRYISHTMFGTRSHFTRFAPVASYHTSDGSRVCTATRGRARRKGGASSPN